MAYGRLGHSPARAVLAASVALILLLAGCGGDEPDEPAGAADPVATTAEPPVEKSEPGGKGGDGSKRDEENKPAPEPEGPGKQSSGGEPAEPGDDDGDQPISKACDFGDSAEECGAISDSGSHEIADGECYESLSAEECEQLKEAYEASGGKDDSRELSDDECYSALTEEQCKELGESAGN
jgi:hypothetical protein